MLGWIITVIALFGLFWWFVHRDPKRHITPIRGFLSPADGIVTKVMRVDRSSQRVKKGKKGGFTMFHDDFPEAKYIVVIMLKIWHVHTQRSPIDGTVSSVFHKDGKKKNAVFGDYLQATVENEHVGMKIEGKQTCKVYMIAGLVARRIVELVSKDDTLKQGEKIAKIKLGSQCVLVLPECDIKVKPGDKVYAGFTEVAS